MAFISNEDSIFGLTDNSRYWAEYATRGYADIAMRKHHELRLDLSGLRTLSDEDLRSLLLVTKALAHLPPNQ